MRRILTILLYFYFALLLLTACNGNQTSDASVTPTIPNVVATPVEAINPTSQSGYPAPEGGLSAYPVPLDSSEEFLTEPPDPERELPVAPGDKGALAGVLVQEVVDKGFIPLNPRDLILAEVVLNSNGEMALLSYGEDSIRAEIFPTGVFVFRDVPPGNYGLVVDLVVSTFPVKNSEGVELTFVVEAGKAVDLGQIIVQLP